jgi:predicted nucleotidyltransferase component of viral defense system
MDLRKIRSLVIVALFSDDELMEQLVLKGGNALDIIYGIGTRSSVDIDLSMADDFADVEEARERIFKGLKNRFASEGYIVFDEKFEAVPSILHKDTNPRWGGYQVEFKITDKESFEKYKNDMQRMRITSTVVNPNQQRKFKIDISKYEFCETKRETELDNFTVYVYSLPMIVLEKIRAICQQMEEYELRPRSKPRARDFYDIHTVITHGEVDITTSENIEMLKSIFEAKEVPIEFLSQIKDTRDFHSTNWDAVKQSVSGELEEFDFYFDFVVNQINKLETVGIK